MLKNKDMKKMLAPIISVIALGIGSYLKLSDSEVSLLEQGLNAVVVGVLTLLGVFGVIKNFDKPDDKN